MSFSTQCGHSSLEASRFCSNCGAARRVATDATSTLSLQGLEPEAEPGETTRLTPVDEAAVEALPQGTAMLVVRRGPNSGSRFLLEEDITTAGRHPESDIFLDDITVSRRHAEFLRKANSFTVRDVGSLNGTYVNRERIDSAPLTGGDEVQIGKYRLVFFGGDPAGQAESGRAEPGQGFSGPSRPDPGSFSREVGAHGRGQGSGT